MDCKIKYEIVDGVEVFSDDEASWFINSEKHIVPICHCCKRKSSDQLVFSPLMGNVCRRCFTGGNSYLNKNRQRMLEEIRRDMRNQLHLEGLAK